MKKKRIGTFFLYSGLLICLIYNSAIAQRPGFSAASPESVNDSTVIKCKAGTKWYEVQVPATGFNFSSPQEAQNITEEVVKAAGFLPGAVTAREAIVGNAAACSSVGVNYILYDPNWFKKVYTDTDERWADRGIFAHELGHFHHNHYMRGLGSTPQMELEADEYAGEILAKMGATLAQAQAAFRSARMQASAHGSHPPTAQRLLAVEKGWRKTAVAAARQRAKSYVDIGMTYYERKDYDSAITNFTNAITIDPTFDDAYHKRAATYINGKKDYDRAIADENIVISLNPNKPEAYYNRGLAYYYKKDYNKAAADFSDAIRLKPSDYNVNVRSYNYRGISYYYLQKYDLSISDYTNVIKMSSKPAYAHRNRGLSWHQQKKYDLAIADFTLAIQIEPNYADAYKSRSISYRAIGKNDLATADEQKVKSLTTR